MEKSKVVFVRIRNKDGTYSMMSFGTRQEAVRYMNQNRITEFNFEKTENMLGLHVSLFRENRI